jgi:predicted nuclease of predicted toxin-antitoxin system
MKMLIDMNLPPRLADILSERGIESIHWFRVGAPDATDTEIMTFARNNNYIVLSCDLDFSTILSVTHGKKPSVIQLRMQGIGTEQIADMISSVCPQNANDLEKGAILTIDTKKSRLRLLPLYSE